MTDGPNYRVKATLELDKNRQAETQAGRIKGELRGVQERLRGANTLAGGLTRNLVGLGLAYSGIRAVAGAMGGLVRQSMQYTSELQGTRIALETVLVAASQGAISMRQAAEMGSEAFDQLRGDAIKSVGTAKDLFQIYNSLVGPIVAAGKQLSVVREITNGTVAAASVLGVDFNQASRDISMMVRGTAGMDVKLFSMLRSTGAIAETTEQWNKSLSSGERIEKLQAALAKFGPAAARYASSWAGVTSTFEDVRNEMSRGFMQPALDGAARGLGHLNDRLIANQGAISERLQAWGERTGNTVESVFGRMANGVDYITKHWDELLARAQRFADKMLTAAKVMAAIKVGSVALAAGSDLVSMGGAAKDMFGGAASALRGGGGGGEVAAAAATAAAAAVAQNSQMMFVNPLTGLTAGGAAPLVGGFATSSEMALSGGFSTAADFAGTGGVAAAGGGAMGGAAAAGGLFATVLVAVADRWKEIAAIGNETLVPLFSEVGGMFGSLWKAAHPLLSVLGQGAALGLTGAMTVISVIARTLVAALTLLFGAIGKVTGAIGDYLQPRFDMLWQLMKDFADKLMEWLKPLLDMLPSGAHPPPPAAYKAAFDMQATPGGIDPNFDVTAGSNRRFNSVTGKSEVYIPMGRQQTINDFRGSRIEVKQTFKEADPDRVLVQMINALGTQAENRLQSGFLPALSR